MNESYIIILMQLFAHLSTFEEGLNYEFVKNFLLILLRKELNIKDYEKYIELFNKYYQSEEKKITTKISFYKLNNLCKKLNEDLPLKQRVITIIYLLKFNRLFKTSPSEELQKFTNLDKAISLISVHFKLKSDDVDNLNAFINNEIQDVSKKNNLIIAGKSNIAYDIKFIERKHLQGIIKFYFIESLNVFVFYLQGPDLLKLNTIEIIPYSVFFLTKGSLITGETSDPIYFNDLLQLILFEKNKSKITMTATDLSFNYKNSVNGVKKINFCAESGQFIAIMGKSGSGKSTLMRLLNGQLKPTTGELKLNGDIIYQNQNRFNDLIGYVPQYDTLISELTAYQNLYYYTKLWNNSLSKQEIDDKINSLLEKLELESIKDRIVGSEYERSISGGERRRLNLALGLIHDPKVLFADEPTSGLSSSDSDTLIKLLHDLVLNGILVIINIHQPSTSVFKTFDKVIILDSGGYPVYMGNPMQAYETLTGYTSADKDRSEKLDSSLIYSADYIFQIIEQKKIDQYGVYTHERKISAEEWHSYFIVSNREAEKTLMTEAKLPESIKTKQSYFVQWMIFFKRNIHIKKGDIQYLLISLLTTPGLALILSILCRSSSNDTGGYLFYYNKNIPSFLFISVIVALFSGLLSSAEEIHRDRLVNARESLLKLSNNSYLLSKVAFLFILSAIQMLIYVVISNSILKIEDMIFNYWMVLWALACTANLIGLILSSMFKSLVSIYIFIPFVLIPQILLSGTVINYKDLHPKITSANYVPLIGDAMPSRWAFEALAVNQFKNNKSEQALFHLDLIISNNSYFSYYLIPDITQHISNAQLLVQQEKKITNTDSLYIANGINTINEWCLVTKKSLIDTKSIKGEKLKTLNNELGNRRQNFILESDRIQAQKEDYIQQSEANDKHNDKNFSNLNNSNLELSKMLLNINDVQAFKKIDGEYIRLYEPIYNIPANKLGKAHLFAPFKRVGGLFIDTYQYDLVVLWFLCIILYILLYIFYSYKIKYNNILVISK